MINTKKLKDRLENLEYQKLKADKLNEKGKVHKSVSNAVWKKWIFDDLNEKEEKWLKIMKDNPDEFIFANLLHNIFLFSNKF